MTPSLIERDELDAILADLKQMWGALADVARQVPGAAAIVEPRSKLPAVIEMVFDQAASSVATTGPYSYETLTGQGDVPVYRIRDAQDNALGRSYAEENAQLIVAALNCYGKADEAKRRAIIAHSRGN